MTNATKTKLTLGCNQIKDLRLAISRAIESELDSIDCHRTELYEDEAGNIAHRFPKEHVNGILRSQKQIRRWKALMRKLK